MRRALLAPSSAAALALLLSAPLTASAGNPWEELMGPDKGQTWSDPDGRFSLGLPINWKATPRKGTDLVDITKFNPDYGQGAHVTVETRALPPGVKAAHLAHRLEQEIRRSAMNYRKLGEDKVEVAGGTARRVHFTYQEHGNAELTNEAVQVLIMSGEKAWIITMLTAAGARSLFWEDFERMVKTFAPEGEGLSLPPSRRTREGRRKLRAGEMVNPDALKY
jgi:hypothetical protein